jgi:hypothetical protein
MIYKCELPEALAKQTLRFFEFANGAAQATVELKNGDVFEKALISGNEAIIALRGYHEPPFIASDIERIYQLEIDMNPKDRSNWDYWDKW